MSEGHEVFQQPLYIGLFYINNCQYLHRKFAIEMTGKATPHFVKRPWSVSVAALYTIVVYHQLSGSSWFFEMQMTGKATPQIAETAWSVSVTALYTIVIYHQLSGSSWIIWNGDDRRSGISPFWKGVKCISTIFKQDCCISSIISILIG